MPPGLRLCFAGTPPFAAAHLAALHRAGHEIAAVFTQPDRPAGRGRKLLPSAVATIAGELGLPLRKPTSMAGEAPATLLASFRPDALIVAAYGLILPKSILETPRLGCINVHASLLPRWRGAAPIERALLAGDQRTGVSIMQMDEGLDTGPVLLQREVAILAGDDRNALETKLAEAGCAALLRSLEHLPELLAGSTPQDNGLATYAGKLGKDDAMIDWTRNARFISRQVRTGIGRMPAFCFAGKRRIRILKAAARDWDRSGTPGKIVEFDKNGLLVACGEGALCITSLQLPGRKPVSPGALLHSAAAPFARGMVLQDRAVG